MAPKNKHERVLNKLLYSDESLRKIGIEGKIWAAKEVPWWKNGRLYCEIDLLVFTGSLYVRPFHVIEYKSNMVDEEYFLTQLMRGEEFVQHNFGQKCYKYFVYKDLEHKMIG